MLPQTQDIHERGLESRLHLNLECYDALSQPTTTCATFDRRDQRRSHLVRLYHLDQTVWYSRNISQTPKVKPVIYVHGRNSCQIGSSSVEKLL